MSKDDFELQNNGQLFNKTGSVSEDNFDIDSFIASAESWLDRTEARDNTVRTEYSVAEPVTEHQIVNSRIDSTESTPKGIYAIHKQESEHEPIKKSQTSAKPLNAEQTGAITQKSSAARTQTSVPSSNSRKKKPVKKVDTRLRRSIYLLFFPIAIFYMELVMNFHCFDQRLGWGLFYTLIFSFGFGFGCLFIVSLFNRKGAYIASIVLTSVLLLIFGIQTVYFYIFKTFTVIAMATMAGDAITGFFDVTVNGIFRSIPWIALLAVPLILTIIFGERILPKKHNKPVGIIFILAACVIATVFGSAIVRANTNGILTYKYVYDETFEVDLSVPRFGILTTIRLEIRNWIWDKTGYVLPQPEEKQEHSGTSNDENVDFGDNINNKNETVTSGELSIGGISIEGKGTEGTITGKLNGKTGNGGTEEGAGEDANNTEQTSPQSPVIPVNTTDTSPHVISSQIVTNSSSSNIEAINDFINSQTPTNKNQYTGIFEGYNLIYICAEGFSRYAIDKEHTPTLYKLSHEGFVFNNFYNPIWTHSTSDGEFALLTGLIPYSGDRPLYTTTDNSSGGKDNMYMSAGNTFKRAGYTTIAYHGHYWDYYSRDQSHPNLGYDYIGVGHGMYLRGSASGEKAQYYFDSSGASSGMIIDYTWPESDIQIMDVTTDQYIYGSKPFHVYYMTISGHGNYSYEGNAMCKKHWDEVADMTVDDTAKAYVACNMELDQAIKLLIDKLQGAGILDKTVIAICGDHYPYLITGNGASVSDDGVATLESLCGEPIDKTFELYRSTLILWNNQIGTIPVDKYCYSVDVLPTLYNLFGINYDSRLLMGSDILSDKEGLVIFSDRSFITDQGRFKASNGKFTPNDGVSVGDSYAAEILDIVKNKVKYSQSIIKYDYYEYVFGS